MRFQRSSPLAALGSIRSTGVGHEEVVLLLVKLARRVDRVVLEDLLLGHRHRPTPGVATENGALRRWGRGGILRRRRAGPAGRREPRPHHQRDRGRVSHGRGPTSAKSYLLEDRYLVCVLKGTMTPVEETLVKRGHADLVRRVRLRFQEAMQESFVELVEEGLGRRVAAYHSQATFDPDIGFEFFALEP
jgi:uncharacterized protein YbcI